MASYCHPLSNESTLLSSAFRSTLNESMHVYSLGLCHHSIQYSKFKPYHTEQKQRIFVSSLNIFSLLVSSYIAVGYRSHRLLQDLFTCSSHPLLKKTLLGIRFFITLGKAFNTGLRNHRGSIFGLSWRFWAFKQHRFVQGPSLPYPKSMLFNKRPAYKKGFLGLGRGIMEALNMLSSAAKVDEKGP